jgi:hypothetical protein
VTLHREAFSSQLPIGPLAARLTEPIQCLTMRRPDAQANDSSLYFQLRPRALKWFAAITA